MKLTEKNKLNILFLAPPFLLWIILIFVFVFLSEKYSLEWFLVSCFLVLVIYQIFLYYHFISPEYDQKQKFNDLLTEQERSSRLLVRRDIELSRVNELLRELDKRKSEFVSIVAHQLRTPLSGIKWTLSMVLKEEMGKITPDQKSFLQKTFDSNERMISLIEDMLYADRLESGKNPLLYENGDITLITDEVLLDLYPKIQGKNLKITFSKRDVVPNIKIDKEKIRAVVQNVLENAVKYSKVASDIIVSITKEAGEIVLSVKDSGIGIPKDQQKYLFTKFFRAKNAMKTETEGTGLGLFIVKNIIDKHGGRMWCESEEGIGTTFFVALKI